MEPVSSDINRSEESLGQLDRFPEAGKNCVIERATGFMAEKEKKIRFAEFELDYARFELCRNGVRVRMESLPLQLLMFLIDHHRHLVTREQIADELWGKDVFVDVEQGINTAIRKIRIALADESIEPQYLQTVVGKGYRFVAGISVTNFSGQAGESFSISPEEFGQALMAAAGLEPDPRKTPTKMPNES
jgi:DNA-binding winged helix-turn-helix (wHTH) protein